MIGEHRKRKKTYNEPGHVHCLTYSCYQRLPLLTRDTTRQWVLSAIGTARKRHDMALWAYVIMPGHVHLLVCPRQASYSMERFLYDCKRPVSWKAKQWLTQNQDLDWLARLTVEKGKRKVFRFWQAGGGFDRNLLKVHGVQAVIEYVHANPVRRGLVESPEEWRWSSAAFWAGCADVPLIPDPFEI